tara:strand:+ start:1633 stop:2622 length:990 start_codon:yes stop_codon:yes gene_type:complete
MRQPTLKSAFSNGAAAATEDHGELEVYDLFCGAGGFTQGAKEAGHRVKYACDSWPLALETYAQNQPGVERVVYLQLPSADIPFPKDGRKFHVHGSPPCQRFSPCGRPFSTTHSTAVAENLVIWFVELAISCGATSWSMEQVSSHETRSMLEALRQKHRGRVAYATVDFELLGVPQIRRRLIAGSPEIVARLLRKCSQDRRRGVKDFVGNPRGTHVHSGTQCHRGRRPVLKPEEGKARFKYDKINMKNRGMLYARPVSEPCPTITGNGDMRWSTKLGPGSFRHVQLNVGELSLLQTFPASYIWPEGRAEANKMVGNSLPPLVARLLLQKE